MAAKDSMRILVLVGFKRKWGLSLVLLVSLAENLKKATNAPRHR
jgi:hypothetical protein